MTSIVGVHGIGNRRAGATPDEAATALGDRWTAAVRGGIGTGTDIEVAVAYYAHRLARDTAQGPTDPAHLVEGEQEILLAWAAALGAPDEVAQGRLTQPVRAAADWIARRFGRDGGVGSRIVFTFCREVHTYLTDAARRDAVRATVASMLAATRPRAVVAHSLGSVVAYETLWAEPAVEVDLLITLGSPLALPGAVFDRLEPAPVEGRGRRPPGVRRWINIADPGDVVAVPRELHRFFDGIDADLTATVGVLAAHKATNYLACPTTAAALATLLGEQSGP